MDQSPVRGAHVWRHEPKDAARLPVSGESEEHVLPGAWCRTHATYEDHTIAAALTRSSEARTAGSESVSPGGDVPQSDGPVVDEPAATDSDALERARELIETIAAASAELATLYGPLWHLTHGFLTGRVHR